MKVSGDLQRENLLRMQNHEDGTTCDVLQAVRYAASLPNDSGLCREDYHIHTQMQVLCVMRKHGS